MDLFFLFSSPRLTPCQADPDGRGFAHFFHELNCETCDTQEHDAWDLWAALSDESRADHAAKEAAIVAVGGRCFLADRYDTPCGGWMNTKLGEAQSPGRTCRRHKSLWEQDLGKELKAEKVAAMPLCANRDSGCCRGASLHADSEFGAKGRFVNALTDVGGLAWCVLSVVSPLATSRAPSAAR